MGAKSKIEQYVIDKVRDKRISEGYSQEKLSLEIGLSAKFVGNVESPKRSEKYNLNHLYKIAELFDCSMRDFFPEGRI